jgi:hypothetical protein
MTTPIPVNTLAPSLESLEKALSNLATVARLVLARVQKDLSGHRYIDTKKHATLARLETVLSDLLSSLS